MSQNGYTHTMSVQGHSVILVTDTPTQGVRSVFCLSCHVPMYRRILGRKWFCSSCYWLWKPRLKELKEELQRTAFLVED